MDIIFLTLAQTDAKTILTTFIVVRFSVIRKFAVTVCDFLRYLNISEKVIFVIVVIIIAIKKNINMLIYLKNSIILYYYTCVTYIY